jgi:hypothetical protein
MADHPDILFKDGPSGRRASLACGPDVWEVIKFLHELDERGPAALEAAAETFGIDPGPIAAAVSYYSEHPSEVDAEIAAADEASARAEEAWRMRHRLISRAGPAPHLPRVLITARKSVAQAECRPSVV